MKVAARSSVAGDSLVVAAVTRPDVGSARPAVVVAVALRCDKRANVVGRRDVVKVRRIWRYASAVRLQIALRGEYRVAAVAATFDRDSFVPVAVQGRAGAAAFAKRSVRNLLPLTASAGFTSADGAGYVAVAKTGSARNVVGGSVSEGSVCAVQKSVVARAVDVSVLAVGAAVKSATVRAISAKVTRAF